MPRSPIPELIERFHGLSPEEQKVFLDLVDPQPEPEPASKKPTKKRAGRSPRAQSISNAIKPATGKQSDAPLLTGGDEDSLNESESGDLCGTCGNNAAYQDHFKPSPNYHAFEAPKSKRAAGN